MAAGWFHDPSARHELRYYDGTAWTGHVADSGVAGWEPLAPPQPPSQPSPPSQPLPPSQPFPPSQPPVATPPPAQQFNAWTDERMRAAAAWWSHRRSRSAGAPDGPPILDYTEQPSVLGEWSGLAAAVGHFAVSAAGVAGGGELIGLLHAITGSADAQAMLLRRIDAKIDALVLGPYQTGRTHLSEAARVGAGDPTQLEHINEAKDCFYLAHGQAVSVQSRALVEYHLGVTWLLLARKSDAVFWFTESYGSAVTVAHELARNADDVRVLNSRTSTAAASYFYPAGVVVLGMKFKKMLAAEQSRDMLREFLPFVACVARSHNALTEAPAHVPAMQLTSSGSTGDGQDLVDVAV